MSVDNREKIPGSKLLKKDKKTNFSSKHKILVASIQPFGIFGEEEVINKKPRKYIAIAGSVLTKLYYIKSKVYYNIFSKLLLHIADAIKRPIADKSRWHDERRYKEEKVTKELVKVPMLEDEDIEKNENATDESNHFDDEEMEQINEIIEFENRKTPQPYDYQVLGSALMERMVLVHNAASKTPKNNKIHMTKLYAAERDKHRGRIKASRQKLLNSKKLAKFKLTNYDFITPMHKMTKILAMQRMERLEQEQREERIKEQARIPMIEIEGIPIPDLRPGSGKPSTPSTQFKLSRPMTTQGLRQVPSDKKSPEPEDVEEIKMVSRGFFAAGLQKKSVVKRPQTANLNLNLNLPQNVSTKIISESPRNLSHTSTLIFKRITSLMKPTDEDAFHDYGMVSPRSLKIQTFSKVPDRSDATTHDMSSRISTAQSPRTIGSVSPRLKTSPSPRIMTAQGPRIRTAQSPRSPNNIFTQTERNIKSGRPDKVRFADELSNENPLMPEIISKPDRSHTEGMETSRTQQLLRDFKSASPIGHYRPDYYTPRNPNNLDFEADGQLSRWTSNDLSDIILTGEKKSIFTVQRTKVYVEGTNKNEKKK